MIGCRGLTVTDRFGSLGKTAATISEADAAETRAKGRGWSHGPRPNLLRRHPQSHAFAKE